MKGLKKFGLIALSFAFVGIAASCGGSDDSAAASSAVTASSHATGLSTEASSAAAGSSAAAESSTATGSSAAASSVAASSAAASSSGIVIEPTDKTVLNSIVLNTTNAKKVFYLGEEFSYEGLVVTKSLAVFDESGKRKGFVQLDTEDYTVDSDLVDMNNIGTYTVNVSVRDGASILTRSYTIEVRTSLFETTPNITYNAGLEVLYADNTRIKEYILNSSEYNADNLINGLKIKLHKKSVDSTGKVVTDLDPIDLAQADVTIENNVNIGAVGTYLIKIKYTGDPVVINGVSHENNLVSFVIVDVVNPITNMTFLSEDNVIFEATVNDIDFESAGWQFRLTPTVGKKYNVNFSYDLFDVSDVDIFKWGETQTIKVTLKEDPSVSVDVSIIINESQTQDITPYYNLTPTIVEYDTETGLPSIITIAGTDFITGPLPKAIDSDNYYATGATYTSGRAGKTSGGVKTDAYGSIDFDERISIKGSSQAFKFVLTKKTDLVVFFAATGDEETDLTVYAANPDGTIGDEIDTGTTGSVKQRPTKHVYSLEAGTYYLIAPGAGIYVHGFVVATEKEA